MQNSGEVKVGVWWRLEPECCWVNSRAVLLPIRALPTPPHFCLLLLPLVRKNWMVILNAKPIKSSPSKFQYWASSSCTVPA